MGGQNTYLELLCASEGTLSRWSRLHLQALSLQFQGGLGGNIFDQIVLFMKVVMLVNQVNKV
jgi:hypothetical protein